MVIHNKLETISLNFKYKEKTTIDNISMKVPDGKFFTILGNSGCGKTTLLKLIGGYIKPTLGSIILDGKDVTYADPGIRQIGMVFQNYILFPHLTCRQNISFPLEVRKTPKNEIDKKIEAIIELVQLNKNDLSRKPSEVSGGQQQRVALARALIFEPKLLLLDEPFANLDKNLKVKLRNEIKILQKTTNITTIMVTHDREEALSNSDFIGIMKHGKMLQIGEPRDIYDKPSSVYIAKFLGETNFLPNEYLGNKEPGKTLVRPEKIKFDKDAIGCDWQKEAKITNVTFRGSDHLVDLITSDGFELKAFLDEKKSQFNNSIVRIGFNYTSSWVTPETNEPD